jgi:dinuclear metal center YbgI/SA1388 family protein
MALIVKELCSVIERLAPEILKENYDNVGLMVGNLDQEVSSILVALDCTFEVIDEAKKNNCNFIFTHHPLLFNKPSSITTESLQGRKIIELIKSDINLYSSHTNLDSLSGGMGDILMALLGFPKGRVIESSTVKGFDDGNNGIGRIVNLEQERTLEMIISEVKERLNLGELRYIGDENMSVNTIAVVNGSGTDYIDLCRKKGADCVITGDVSYHYASDSKEQNLAIIDAGHFGTEWCAFIEFSKKVQLEISSLGYKNNIMISKKVSDPYKTK